MAKRITNNAKEIVSNEVQDEAKQILFNFKYFTEKKQHGFRFFGKNKNNKLEAYEQLYTRLSSLSCRTIQECRGLGKIQGCEEIPYNDFNDSFKSVLENIAIVSKDSKLSVFRFNNQDYRLICKSGIKDNNILYIIGIDWDFSAYSH